MKLRKITDGKCWSIFAVQKQNYCQVIDFIDSLPERDHMQAVQRIEDLANSAQIRNEEKFRKIEQGIYELKTRNLVRFLCFYGVNRTIILTHGFKKRKRKTFRQETEKALIALKEYELQPIREIIS